jgi:hypothetical protein
MRHSRGAALQTEVVALRHQLNVLRPKRVAVSNIDRLVFAGLYHLSPEVLDAVKILKLRQAARATRISSGGRFEAPLVNMGDCREADGVGRPIVPPRK